MGVGDGRRIDSDRPRDLAITVDITSDVATAELHMRTNFGYVGSLGQPSLTAWRTTNDADFQT